jgi:UDPglucose 6-dehydrogenase
MIKGINFIGLGKLGLPLATCIAKNGINVNAIDKNEELILKLNQNDIPWLEEGLSKNLEISRPNINYSNNFDLIDKFEISIILVNTPSNKKDGSFSNIFVEQVLMEIGKRMKKGHTIILSSTVMPGSILESFVPLIENLSGLSLKKGEFGFGYVPDFVALGNIIHDFENPDFLVIGNSDNITFQKAKEIYSRILRNSPEILNRSLPETELIKVSLNAYITTKISFANFLGLMARRMKGNINVDAVTSAVGLDSRIGRKYFNSGVSYGGTCFPRDTWAFIKSAENVGLNAQQMHANEIINDLVDKEWLSEILLSECEQVYLIGASFKPGTSVTTEGMTEKLLPKLIKRNLKVFVVDDNIEALANIKKLFFDVNVNFSDTSLEFQENSIIIVTIPDKRYTLLNFGNNKILDPWNLFRR